MSAQSCKQFLPSASLKPLRIFRVADNSAITCVQFLSENHQVCCKRELAELNDQRLFSEASASHKTRENDLPDSCSATENMSCVTSEGRNSGHTSLLAIGAMSGNITIYDLKSNTEAASWTAHTKSVLSVKELSASSVLTIGRMDSLKVWELVFRSSNVNVEFPKVCVTPEVDAMCSCLAGEKCTSRFCTSTFSASANDIARASSQRVTVTCVASLNLSNYLGFAKLDLLRQEDKTLVAFPDEDLSAIAVGLVGEGHKSAVLLPDDAKEFGSVVLIKWITTHNIILAAYESGKISLWDWTNSSPLCVVQLTGVPLSVDYLPATCSGLIGTTENGIYLFKISLSGDGVPRIALEHVLPDLEEGIGCCAFRPDGKLFAAGEWGGNIRIYRWKRHKLLALIDFHKDSVTCLDYSRSKLCILDELVNKGSEHILASGSSDGRVCLWKLY